MGTVGELDPSSLSDDLKLSMVVAVAIVLVVQVAIDKVIDMVAVRLDFESRPPGHALRSLRRGSGDASVHRGDSRCVHYVRLPYARNLFRGHGHGFRGGVTFSDLSNSFFKDKTKGKTRGALRRWANRAVGLTAVSQTVFDQRSDVVIGKRVVNVLTLATGAHEPLGA